MNIRLFHTVYTIKPENGSAPAKKVHRNNLMNCNFLLPEIDDSDKPNRINPTEIEEWL